MSSAGGNNHSTRTHHTLLHINTNDHTKGWQNLNPLSHPNATLAPQARQARASGENFNYVTLALLARQAILNYSVCC